MPRLSRLVLLVLACSLIFPREPATSCAPAPPPGAIVRIASEAAIIVWDAAAKREHFIRRAAFDTSAADFGFLVPTPSRPTLTEVDQHAFDQLAEITAPKINYVKRPVQAQPGCGCSADHPLVKSVAAPAPNAQPTVEVLEEKRIAGQDAAVLAADDAEALQTWLKDHGYEFSPMLTEWVQPYLDQKWVITAFKYAKDDKAAAPELQTAAVCMSFDAERPFYPYREPKADKTDEPTTDSRLLRVFFLAAEKMQGVLDHAEQRWPGSTVYAKPLENQRTGVFELLKLVELKTEGDWWLTEFEDASTPRPGIADVYFSPAKDQDHVERPPITVYVSTRGFPFDLTFSVLAVGLAAMGLQRLRRK